MVVVRMLPLPFVVVDAAAGVTSMRWRDFALGSMVGSLPVMLVYTYFASALAKHVEGAEQRALVHVLAAGGLVLASSFASQLLARSWRTRQATGRNGSAGRA